MCIIKAPYTEKRELADRDGLTARITANAIITFNYRFRWQGKQQRIKIGRLLATRSLAHEFQISHVLMA